ENQSYRTLRIPAVRGKILDRNGSILAENRPSYNLGLYLEEFRKPFEKTYLKLLSRERAKLQQQIGEQERVLGRKLSKKEKRQFSLTQQQRVGLRKEARGEGVSNVVIEIGKRLGQPLAFDAVKFEQHYNARLALPYPILTDLTSTQIALFQEQS